MTSDRPRRSTYRKIAAAAGVLSVFSLAGCSETDSGSPSQSNDRSDGTGDDDASPGGPDPGDTGTPSGEDSVDRNGTPSRDGGTADAACDEEALAALGDEVGELEEQLVNIEFEGQSLRTGSRATEYLLGQLDPGFPEHTIERGRAIGIAARPSVVTLEMLDGGYSSGHATAWFVDDGYLFTNAHNVYPRGPDSEFRGVTQDGDSFDVEVVDLVEEMSPDVALLRTEYNGADPLPMTTVDELEAGDPLVQVGNPSEVGFWIISMGRFVTDRPAFAPDGTEYTALKSVVPGRPGVSGSPLLTLDGEVVGMTNGGQPVSPSRELGTPPPVAPDIVFDGPIGDVVVSLHDGSDVLEQKLEEWR